MGGRRAGDGRATGLVVAARLNSIDAPSKEKRPLFERALNVLLGA
jgi:hypothetical protein